MYSCAAARLGAVFLASLTLGFVAVNGRGEQSPALDDFEVQNAQIFPRLLQQYTALISLHFKASVQTTVDYDLAKALLEAPTNSSPQGGQVDQSGRRTSDGYYEMWMMDGRFRIESSLGEDSGEFEIAWDGTQLQYFDRAFGRMTVSTNLTDEMGAIPINPLLAPFEILKEVQDTNSGIRQLMFTDLEDPVCQERLRVYRRSTNSSEIVELPGGRQNGRQFYYKVHIITEPFSLPSLIEYVDVDPIGKLIGRTEIDYSSRGINGSVECWPHTIIRESFTAQGGMIAKQVMNIEALDLDQQIDASTFRIDRKRVSRIWDGDRRVFVEHRSAFLQRSRGVFLSLILLISVGGMFLIIRRYLSGSRADRI